jgi:hypothetical protein
MGIENQVRCLMLTSLGAIQPTPTEAQSRTNPPRTSSSPGTRRTGMPRVH